MYTVFARNPAAPAGTTINLRITIGLKVFDTRSDIAGVVGSFVMQLSVQRQGGRRGNCEPFVNLLRPARAGGIRGHQTANCRLAVEWVSGRRQSWVRDPAWSKTSTLQTAWKGFSLTMSLQVSIFLRIVGSERWLHIRTCRCRALEQIRFSMELSDASQTEDIQGSDAKASQPSCQGRPEHCRLPPVQLAEVAPRGL